MRTRMIFLLAVVFLLFAGCASTDDSLTGQATHGMYTAFSASEQGFRLGNGLVLASDTVVYKTGWYSVNGSAWQQLSLSGSSYGSSSSWLSGAASVPLPAALSVPGEHYLIVYSCTWSSEAWDCHGDTPAAGGWQLRIISGTPSSCSNHIQDGAETGIDCGGECIDCVEQADYYVAPNGSDSWPGTLTQPWKTWSKAFHSAQPGNLVYFRGGVYPTDVTDGSGLKYIPAQGLGHDGTPENPIRYFNYPGEKPVLDFAGALASPAEGSWNVLSYGITLEGVDYVHLKGLEVMNVRQRPYPNENGIYDVTHGIRAEYCDHLILENMIVHDVGDVGISNSNNYYIEIINCDVYNVCDFYHHTLPGNGGTCFGGGTQENFTQGYSYYYGNRAWNCSDQGYTSPTYSYNVFENCWSFGNGMLQGGGIGWKLGYWYEPAKKDLVITMKNCIAADNLGDGVTGNEGSHTRVGPYQLYNNFVYNSGRHGFAVRNANSSDTEELKRTLRNNVAYVYGTSGHGFACYANPLNPESLYTHSNNSWDSPVTVNDDDFISLDTSQLYAPRKPNGDLPDITFGKLRADSDLIDKGVNVSLPYNGPTPDLGAFEYQS